MKILITGSSGYVGYILSKYFSEKGIEVIGMDIAENPAWTGNSHFKFIESDVTDLAELKRIFFVEQPTHVIHLAFLMNPMHDHKMNYDIDVGGSVNTMIAADSTLSVKQFLQFSSASAYGAWPKNKLWLSESDILLPRDYRYGIHKKKIEDMYSWFYKRDDLNLVVVRMCTAVGPLYHKKGGVVSILANSPLMLRLNNRYCELQFLHEDDLTALVELILHDTTVTGTFNLAPDSFATTKELASSKFHIPLPLWLARGIANVLWGIRIAPMMPSAMTLSTYGIVVDPAKIINRYKYKFKFSTLDAFTETVKKRKKLGTL